MKIIIYIYHGKPQISIPTQYHVESVGFNTWNQYDAPPQPQFASLSHKTTDCCVPSNYIVILCWFYIWHWRYEWLRIIFLHWFNRNTDPAGQDSRTVFSTGFACPVDGLSRFKSVTCRKVYHYRRWWKEVSTHIKKKTLKYLCYALLASYGRGEIKHMTHSS